jgi:hypothetical protein
MPYLPEPVGCGRMWQMLGSVLLKGMDGWDKAFRLAFLGIVFGGLYAAIWLVTR